MSIFLTEGFDLVTTTTDVIAKTFPFAEGSINATANQFGGPAWNLTTDDNTVLCVNLPVSALGTFISIACWRKFSSVPDVPSGAIMCIGDNVAIGTTVAVNSAHAYLQFAAGGGIRVSGGNNSLIETLPAKIKANVWQHYEMRCFIDNNPLGRFEFWLDGIQELDFTGDVRDTTAFGNVQFTGCNGVTDSFIDDIVIAQDATTELPQIGSHRIHTLLPDGAGTNSAWTGTNLDVDDPFGASDGDTTFASESVLNDKQDYSFDDLSESPASVISVTSVVEARKTDSGTVGLTPFLLSNAVTGLGAEVGLSEAYSFNSDIFELNPDGSVAWTEATINALQAGHEITT